MSNELQIGRRAEGAAMASLPGQVKGAASAQHFGEKSPLRDELMMKPCKAPFASRQKTLFVPEDARGGLDCKK